MWQLSSHSQDRYSRSWDGELWAGPGAVPLLVQELALLQLRSLLGVDSQDSSVLEAVAVELPESSEDPPGDAGARP